MYACFGVYDCFMSGYTISPNQRIVQHSYREITMEKLRTSEKVPTSRSNELKQV